MSEWNNIIETQRLLLRPWSDSDAAALFRYACDPDIGPVAGWAPHRSEEESLKIIHTVFSRPKSTPSCRKTPWSPSAAAE